MGGDLRPQPVSGGWKFSTIFAAGSGMPARVGTTYADFQAFGASDGVGGADHDMENAIPIGPTPLVHQLAFSHFVSVHKLHRSLPGFRVRRCPVRHSSNTVSSGVYASPALTSRPVLS